MVAAVASCVLVLPGPLCKRLISSRAPAPHYTRTRHVRCPSAPARPPQTPAPTAQHSRLRAVVVFTHTYGKRAVNRKSLTPPYMHSTSCAVPVELQTLFGTACSKEPKSTVWTPGAPSTRLRRGTQRRPTRPRRQRHWRRLCPRAHSGANRRPAAPCRSRVSGIAAIAPCEDERGRPHGTGHGVGRRDEATSCSFAYTA